MCVCVCVCEREREREREREIERGQQQQQQQQCGHCNVIPVSKDLITTILCGSGRSAAFET